jgi:zinc protease
MALHPWGRLCALVLAASSCVSTRGSTLPPEGDLGFTKFSFTNTESRLPSGLRILIHRGPGDTQAAVVVAVRAGGGQDPPGKEGLAHLVEHLTFRATDAQGRTLSHRLERAGAIASNAESTSEATLYHARATKGRLGPVLAAELGRLADPLAGVTEQVFLREREVVRSELRENNENEGLGALLDAAMRATYPTGHPYVRPVRGSHRSLDAITLDDARRFVKEHYRPDNAVVVLAGDVPETAEELRPLLSDAVPRALAGQSAQKVASKTLSAPPPSPEPPAPPATKMVVEKGPVTAPEVWVLWSLPGSYSGQRLRNLLVSHALDRAIWEAGGGDLINEFHVQVVGGVLAETLLIRALLKEGASAENAGDWIVDQVYRIWWRNFGMKALRSDIGMAAMVFDSVTEVIEQNEDPMTRAKVRAHQTLFTGSSDTFAQDLGELAGIKPMVIAEYAQKTLARDNARYLHVVPAGGARGANVKTQAAADAKAPIATEPFEIASDELQAAATPTAIEHRTLALANGLEVILMRRPSLPLITAGLGFVGGSALSDPPGAEGVLTSYTDRGTPLHGWPSLRGIRVWLAHRPTFAFEAAVAGSRNLPAALAALRDRTEGVFSRGFRDPQPGAPGAHLDRTFEEALLEGTPYSPSRPATRSPAGRSGTEAWVRKTRVPANAILAIAGDVALDVMEREVRTWFADWPDSTTGPRLRTDGARPLKDPTTHVRFVDSPGATQAGIRVGCRVPSRTTAEQVAATVLVAYVRLRLEETLRENLGATYGVSGTDDLYPSPLHVLRWWTHIDAGRFADGLQAWRALANELAGGNVDDRTFRRARWSVAQSMNDTRTNRQLVEQALQLAAAGVALDARAKVSGALASLKPADLVSIFAACRAGTTAVVDANGSALKSALQTAWQDRGP